MHRTSECICHAMMVRTIHVCAVYVLYGIWIAGICPYMQSYAVSVDTQFW